MKHKVERMFARKQMSAAWGTIVAVSVLLIAGILRFPLLGLEAFLLSVALLSLWTVAVRQLILVPRNLAVNVSRLILLVGLGGTWSSASLAVVIGSEQARVVSFWFHIVIFLAMLYYALYSLSWSSVELFIREHAPPPGPSRDALALILAIGSFAWTFWFFFSPDVYLRPSGLLVIIFVWTAVLRQFIAFVGRGVEASRKIQFVSFFLSSVLILSGFLVADANLVSSAVLVQFLAFAGMLFYLFKQVYSAGDLD